MLDQQTGQEVYAFVHTLNAMGRPDTLLLDPSLVYKVVIHTIPSITLSNIRLIPGKHTVLSTPAAQGDMSLSTAARPSRPIKAVIRQAGKGETLEAIELGAPLRLLAGKYDVELLTLPRIKFDGVEVKHGTVATRQIQTPGQVTFQLPARGVASLFTTGSKVEKIYTLPISVQGETVQMQPGTYRLIYRSAGSTATVTSQEKTFKVLAGQTTIVKI
jgi:Ca-activated chloride channel homolog